MSEAMVRASSQGSPSSCSLQENWEASKHSMQIHTGPLMLISEIILHVGIGIQDVLVYGQQFLAVRFEKFGYGQDVFLR